jgi:uroporphyrinogen-III synthase
MRYLVTRPEPDAQATADAVAARGHEALVDPMLRVALGPVGTLDLFGVQAVAVTSPNGVRALSDAAAIKALPVFAVGAATATLAREQGFHTVLSAEGDGAALGALIAMRADPAAGVILWAHGHDKSHDLVGDLAARGFRGRAIEVYRAEPASALAPATAAALKTGTLDGVLVFSPRTGRTFLSCLEAAGLTDMARRLTVHALSDKVAASFQAAGFDQVVTAAKPTAEALYRTLPKAALKPRRSVNTRARRVYAKADV